LAKKKIYPTLWYLYKESLVPEHTLFVGYARSALDVQKLKESTEKYLQFRDDADRSRLESFWALNHFVQGSYDCPEDFKRLNDHVSKLEEAAHVAADSCGNTCGDCNRLFYLALPPSVFQSATDLIRHHCWSDCGFNRVIIEKPFGRDLDSAIQLNLHVESLFAENEVYRIDHYLGIFQYSNKLFELEQILIIEINSNISGKEMVQNLITLRFGNRIFSPIWNRDHIASVMITFKEPFGTQGRGGYFDQFGRYFWNFY
jgi:glucose-6-phosphate 1-dehydrogenase